MGEGPPPPSLGRRDEATASATGGTRGSRDLLDYLPIPRLRAPVVALDAQAVPDASRRVSLTVYTTLFKSHQPWPTAARLPHVSPRRPLLRYSTGELWEYRQPAQTFGYCRSDIFPPILLRVRRRWHRSAARGDWPPTGPRRAR